MTVIGTNVRRIDGVEKDIRLDNGMVVCGEQKLSFPEVMQRHFRDTEGEIWGRGFFKVPRNDSVPLGYPSPFWEIGLGAAEVRSIPKPEK